MRLVTVAALAFALDACESVLPSGKSETLSEWNTFGEAKAAYDEIVVGDTTRSVLAEIGYDPMVNPNVEILTYLALISLFMPHQSIQLTDLDPRLRECLAARGACSGYRVGPKRIASKRTGDPVLDIFGFERKTEKKGWSFSALVVLHGDVVAYKIWSGKPRLHERTETKKPLGPLQDSGDILRDLVWP